MQPKELKVLFVDDMASIRAQARSLFKRLGVLDFYEASDGLDALKMCEQAVSEGKKFDVILSDLNMVGMNGFELLKTVRRHPDLSIQYVKFIMVTTKSTNVLTAINLGANQCLHKPFDENDLGLRLVWVFGDKWQGENFILSPHQTAEKLDF
jgi:CheY-like chemotaxis protein